MGNYPRLDPDADRQADDDHLRGIVALYGIAANEERCRTHGPYPARLGPECPLCIIDEHLTRPRRRWRKDDN